MAIQKITLPVTFALTNVTVPAPPTNGVVNDTTNTFNWTDSAGLTALSDYEFTVNGGASYAPVTAKPIVIGDVSLGIGQVGVRVKAIAGQRAASTTLFNLTAFTGSLVTPPTPTNPVTNDTTNTFDWTYSAGYTTATLYEYTINGGTSWNAVTVKPIPIGNIALAANQVGVRVKAASGNVASGTLFATAPFTVTSGGGGGLGADGTINPTSFLADVHANGSIDADTETALTDLVTAVNDTTGEALSMFPYVGGNVTTNLYQLGDLIGDLIYAGGTLDVNAQGFKNVNSSSGVYASFGFGALDINNFTFIVYNDDATTQGGIDMGVAGPNALLGAYISVNKTGAPEVRFGSTNLVPTDNTVTGLFVLTVNDGVATLYRNGTAIGTLTVPEGSYFPETQIGILRIGISCVYYDTVGLIEQTLRRRKFDMILNSGISLQQVQALTVPVTNYVNSK